MKLFLCFQCCDVSKLRVSLKGTRLFASVTSSSIFFIVHPLLTSMAPPQSSSAGIALEFLSNTRTPSFLLNSLGWRTHSHFSLTTSISPGAFVVVVARTHSFDSPFWVYHWEMREQQIYLCVFLSTLLMSHQSWTDTERSHVADQDVRVFFMNPLVARALQAFAQLTGHSNWTWSQTVGTLALK